MIFNKTQNFAKVEESNCILRVFISFSFYFLKEKGIKFFKK